MATDLYYQYIKGKSPCYVFLHGLGGDSSVWSFMLPVIQQKGNAFLSIDLPGHGLSTRDCSCRIPDVAQAINRVLDQEKIKQVVLVGHCFGGVIALEQFFSHRPKLKIVQLILIGSFCQPSFWHRQFLKFLAYARFFKQRSLIEQIDFQTFYSTGDIDLRRFLSDLRHVGWSNYGRFCQNLAHWNRESSLAGISIPVLVIAGKKDRVVSLAQQRKMTSQLGNSQLIVIDSNHIAPINNPDAVRQAVLGISAKILG
jgi:3-oxoadipate enol-lactonase/4-carboxymuconolactone decarboxylase